MKNLPYAVRCIDALAGLCALKAIKKQIEAGTASNEQKAHYEANKDAAWSRAFDALEIAQ